MKILCGIAAATFYVACPAAVMAITYFVNGANPTPIPPFTNWATAATTIQHAVD